MMPDQTMRGSVMVKYQAHALKIAVQVCAPPENRGVSMPFIYKIINDINDKVYVGKTLDSIEKRFKEHVSDCKRRHLENRP